MPVNQILFFQGSTAPFTLETNHGLGYRSGMLQTWNKFCFTTGYVEVNVTFPGPNENTTGYVSFLLFRFSFDYFSSFLSLVIYIGTHGPFVFYLLVAWCVDHGKPCKTRIHSDYRWNVAVYVRSSLLF